MTYYTYILTCADGTLYIGSTNNLAERVRTHNESPRGAKYTRVRRPVALSYSETFASKSDALKREYALKQLRRVDKLKLIKTSQTKLR